MRIYTQFYHHTHIIYLDFKYVQYVEYNDIYLLELHVVAKHPLVHPIRVKKNYN